MNTTVLQSDLRLDLIPEQPELLPVRLVCGQQVVIGRNQHECDLVSWLLPRNAENDRETLKLSQVHSYLFQEGTKLRLRDADSATGTFWNGQAVPLGQGITAAWGLEGRLSLGRNFHVSLAWLPSEHPRCAVLRPLVSEPAIRQCLWMTVARCGFMIRPDEPSRWLHPATSGETADVVVEIRGRELWWSPADGNAVRIEDGAELSAGEFRMKAALR